MTERDLRTTGPGERVAAALLWILAAVASSALVGAVLIGGAEQFGPPDDPATIAFVLFLALASMAFATAGILVVVRRPGNIIGWLMLAIGPLISGAFTGFALGALSTAALGPDDLRAGFLSMLGVTTLLPALALVGILTLVYPTGHFLSRRWAWLTAIVAAPIVLDELLIVIRPGQLDPTLARNPLGFGTFLPMEQAVIFDGIAYPATFLLVLLGFLSMLVRLRGADAVTRQQLKWFLAAVAVIFVTGVASSLGESNSNDVIDLLAVASYALLPTAVCIAILRYRLYEIDRLVSRTVSWAIVTAVLVATFAAGLLALQTILADVTQGDTIAVAASTLIALAVFQPVRRRVQRAVDRRFDRSRYDAERVIDDFGTRLRDQLDLSLLRSEVGRVATETVRPTRASVWIRPIRPGGR